MGYGMCNVETARSEVYRLAKLIRLTVWLCLLVAAPAAGQTPVPFVVTGAGAGGGPHVRVLDPTTGTEILGFYAYDIGFAGGVRVATADVNNDGVPDILTAAGAGGGPHVRVFDGASVLMGRVVEILGLFRVRPEL